MQLSCAAELAVRGALVLASEYGRGPVTLDSVCARRDLPKQYLVKIFSSLAKANLVEATRGKKGGYALSRAPEDITVLNVVEAVQGRIVLNLCQFDPPKCDELDCALRPMWAKLQETVRRELSSVTLASCLRTAVAAKPQSG